MVCRIKQPPSSLAYLCVVVQQDVATQSAYERDHGCLETVHRDKPRPKLLYSEAVEVTLVRGYRAWHGRESLPLTDDD